MADAIVPAPTTTTSPAARLSRTLCRSHSLLNLIACLMHYTLHKSNGSFSINYDCRDMDNGIIGSLDDPSEAIATARTLEDAIEAAYAHVGRFPTDSLYVIDSDHRVHDIILSELYHEERTASAKSLFVAWACFTICSLSFAFTAITGIGVAGMGFFVVSLSVYVGMVRYGIFNEIESLVVCIILSVLVAMFVPAISQLLNAT